MKNQVNLINNPQLNSFSKFETYCTSIGLLYDD